MKASLTTPRRKLLSPATARNAALVNHNDVGLSIAVKVRGHELITRVQTTRYSDVLKRMEMRSDLFPRVGLPVGRSERFHLRLRLLREADAHYREATNQYACWHFRRRSSILSLTHWPRSPLHAR